MNKLCLGMLFAATIALPQAAFGHGDPVFLTLGNDGRLKTDSHTYGTLPDDIGSPYFFTQLPGFSVHQGDSSIPAGTQIAVSVLSSLHFSSGLSDPPEPDDNGSQLFIDGFVGGHIATGATGYLTPLTVAAYDPLPTADWHEHLFYTLEALASEAGAYGVLLQVMSPNHPEILHSEPFALIFNAAMDEGDFSSVSAVMARELLSTGDVNFNFVVNIQDLTIVAENWLTPGPTGDANYDGVVNISDLTLVATNWLNEIGPGPGGYFPPPALVPEPASWLLGSMALFGFGCLAITCRRGSRGRPV